MSFIENDKKKMVNNDSIYKMLRDQTTRYSHNKNGTYMYSYADPLNLQMNNICQTM